MPSAKCLRKIIGVIRLLASMLDPGRSDSRTRLAARSGMGVVWVRVFLRHPGMKVSEWRHAHPQLGHCVRCSCEFNKCLGLAHTCPKTYMNE